MGPERWLTGDGETMIDRELVERLCGTNTVGRTEADIQSDIQTLLLTGGFNLGGGPRLEEQLEDGSRRRIDVAAGTTVIEVKRKLTTEPDAAGYVAQLEGYVRTRMNQAESRYNGILTDGHTWRLYEVDPRTDTFSRRSEFVLTKPDKADRLVDWLQAVLATPKDIKPTRESIEQYLGSSSPAYAQDSAYLVGMFNQVKADPTVALKRQLWARLLRSALGTGFSDDDSLFLDHTLLVVEAAIIGHAVMGLPLAHLAGEPRRLLSGEEFENAGIHNVIESDFFDWILTAPFGQRFVARLVRRIGVFDWSRTDHDVLKVLYESVINPTTRKGLGEYYTPDWLAEGIIQQAVTEPLTQKVLDPACGSGTFIYAAVRTIIHSYETRAADRAVPVDNRALLKHLETHVFGLDIHPVSVVFARITYLLALGARLQEERDEVWVPIHLGDSMQWQQPAGSSGDDSVIRVDTTGEDLTVKNDASDTMSALFDVASVLAFPLSATQDPTTFDRLVTAMTDRAKTYTDPALKRPRVDSILDRFGVTDNHDRQILRETFNLLCDLNCQGRDSIWGYFIRNQVRPLWLSMETRQVDVLVGNPPWVAYRFMTKTMQEQFQKLCKLRGLWHGRQVATQQDLVALFIVRSVEKYLKVGGRFGFVTPLAVLSRKHYDGFRSGQWGFTASATMDTVWDLDKVSPRGDLFPVPAAVVFGTRQPVEPITGKTIGHRGMTRTKLVVEGRRDKRGWEQSRHHLTFTPSPNNMITSANAGKDGYGTFVTNGATIFPRFLFFITEEAGAGKLGQSAGRVAFRSMRTNQEKVPWKGLGDLTGVVGRRYIFDTHLGSTIAPFRTLEPWRAILPIANDKLLTDTEINEGPDTGLAAWWDQATTAWEGHKTKQSTLSLREQVDFQGKLTRQLSAGSHRVVYSKAGTRLAAARLDDPDAIIDHTLYWLSVATMDEARYLTAILNAPATTTAVSGYQSRGLFGARHFDKYVWMLPIPRYNSANEDHLSLVRLAARAEELAADLDLEGHGFQTARKIVRDTLCSAGITAQIDAIVAPMVNGES